MCALKSLMSQVLSNTSGKSVFRHQNWGELRPSLPPYSAAYVLERRERVFKLFPLSISREVSISFGPA